MAGFDADFAQKLNITQQEANSHQAAATAQANLLNQQATQVAPNAASQRDLTAAQTFGANTAANLAPLEFGSQDALRRSQGAESYARANTFGIEGQNSLFGFGDQQRQVQATRGNGAKTGMTKVPGTGDGTVDKVPAKLAPGEAVLNKAAAEHLGRDTIALLNAIGSAKMGLNVNPQTAAPEPAKGQQGYAKGTAKVASKAKGKGGGKAPDPAAAAGAQGPGGMSPQVMQALMQMQQGGGMPPAGGPQQPLPMPTPQVAR
jgi:hypothetical protein